MMINDNDYNDDDDSDERMIFSADDRQRLTTIQGLRKEKIQRETNNEMRETNNEIERETNNELRETKNEIERDEHKLTSKEITRDSSVNFTMEDLGN